MIHIHPVDRTSFVFANASAQVNKNHLPQHEEEAAPSAVDHMPSSETIPMPSSHIHRTRSELQLREDMAAAEWRDMCMFHRLVKGMRERQQAHFASHQRECQQTSDGSCGHYRRTVQTTPLAKNVAPIRQEKVADYYRDAPHTREHINSDWSVSGYEEHQTCSNWAESVADIISYEDDELEGEIFSLDL